MEVGSTGLVATTAQMHSEGVVTGLCADNKQAQAPPHRWVRLLETSDEDDGDEWQDRGGDEKEFSGQGHVEQVLGRAGAGDDPVPAILDALLTPRLVSITESVPQHLEKCITERASVSELLPSMPLESAERGRQELGKIMIIPVSIPSPSRQQTGEAGECEVKQAKMAQDKKAKDLMELGEAARSLIADIDQAHARRVLRSIGMRRFAQLRAPRTSTHKHARVHSSHERHRLFLTHTT